MSGFRVSFFNVIPDSTGHDHDCCQRTIDVPEAGGSKEAVELAKREFERLEGVAHWRVHAEFVDCRDASAPLTRSAKVSD